MQCQDTRYYLHLWNIINASCFHLFLFLPLTCSVLPLDSRVCVLSGFKSKLSLSQLILGVGFPSTWHSSSVDLFTNTITSSGTSLSAPRIEGGTARRNTHTYSHTLMKQSQLHANSQQIERFHKLPHLVFENYVHKTLISYWTESSPASLMATHVYLPESSVWVRGICSTLPPLHKTQK